MIFKINDLLENLILYYLATAENDAFLRGHKMTINISHTLSLQFFIFSLKIEKMRD